jgi:hypothetical protein
VEEGLDALCVLLGLCAYLRLTSAYCAYSPKVLTNVIPTIYISSKSGVPGKGQRKTSMLFASCCRCVRAYGSLALIALYSWSLEACTRVHNMCERRPEPLRICSASFAPFGSCAVPRKTLTLRHHSNAYVCALALLALIVHILPEFRRLHKSA